MIDIDGRQWYVVKVTEGRTRWYEVRRGALVVSNYWGTVRFRTKWRALRAARRRNSRTQQREIVA